MTAFNRLQAILNDLSPDLQEEVVEFAQHLLDNQVIGLDLDKDTKFFICPTCFKVSRKQIECHDHLMISCNAEKLEDCKPLMDSSGEFNSRAPRWFIVSVNRQYKDQIRNQ